MDSDILSAWFDDLTERLETAYLATRHPWGRSGFAGPLERWIACRKPIADCVVHSGSFLDIGCANGYLLESILDWTAQRGLTVVPYGLDLSERLVHVAKARLAAYNDNLFVGNGLYWDPPVRFDFVHTELVYVPHHLQRQYVERLLSLFLEDNGTLPVTEYRNRTSARGQEWADETIMGWGLAVERTATGFWEGKELTRVVCILQKR